MKTVCVLMSTYNGEKYLREQINSILNQKDCAIELYIRDDGSSDNTISIIKELMQVHANIHLNEASNVGACMSFFNILWEAPLDYDYYAFCDQDDFWLEDKLKRAVESLEKSEDDIKVYSSGIQVVNQDLEKISDTPISNAKPSFGNSLIENIVSGCTAVMSKGFVKLARSYEMPTQQYMHDWWIYKMAMAYGTLVYDTNAYILYRQHGGNTVGLADSFMDRVKNVLSKQRKIKDYVTKQNLEFEKIYALSDEKTKLLSVCNHNRFKRLFNSKLVRQSKVETFIYRMWMLFW